MISESSTLADIVRNNPSSAGTLFKYGLDYCCGGKMNLEEACKVMAVNPTEVINEIQRNDSPPTLGQNHTGLWSTSFLTTFIENNHHQYLRSAIPVLEGHIQTVIDKHGSRYPELKAIYELVEDLGRGLLQHIEEEEKGVFNSDLNRTPQDINDEIDQHVNEHTLVGTKLMRLRSLTNNFTAPNGACTTHRMAYHLLGEFVEDTMQHVFLENEVLFPQLRSNQLNNACTITIQG